MMVMSAPRASGPWLTICPKRPKPMMSTLPQESCTASTPSSDRAGARASRRCASTASGVSAIDTTTTAVMRALTCPLITPCDCAAL